MKALRLFAILAVFLAAACDSPATSGGVDALKAAGKGRVVAVVDGDTVVLDDGREVRLVGIQAPKLPLGRRDFAKWPLADEAKAAMVDLFLGREVTLRQGGAPMDRHGRILAHMVRDDGTWAQGEMLRKGLARMYTFSDNRALVPDMLAREQAARKEGLGIWSHDYYALRDAVSVADTVDSFQIVEARVVDTARVKGRVYLNFGRNWRTDFTISLGRAADKMFGKAGVDPLALKGRSVRVRGWVTWRNGPAIEATHPEQIEVLGR